MDLRATLTEAARRRDGRVVLPEGEEPRVIQAARRLRDESIARPILLGDPAKIGAVAREQGIEIGDLQCIRPAEAEELTGYAEAYRDRRGLKESLARRMVTKPLFFGGMMVACGDAEAMVAGVAHATASVIQAGALTIGLGEGIETPSSFFLMVLPEFAGVRDRPFIFADCAVTICPTAAQLADIALASHASARKLLPETPRVALLSFSTLGSAAHEQVDKVKQAVSIARQRAPDALIEGEFQFDTAIVADVAAKKVKTHSDVAGQANVLIFPDLNTGNVAYKLAQYMAGARAIGPFLQGFARPISDLSRGASADDIVATTAIVLAMT
jgi:phosphate acetyltransferase